MRASAFRTRRWITLATLAALSCVQEPNLGAGHQETREHHQDQGTR